MNLRFLTDDQLHASNLESTDKERRATLEVLKHLSETERRRLYSKFSCDSLHAYCVKHLKYSEGQAGRHVAASRLLQELPVIEEKVMTGAMTFTSLCQASSYFRKEAQAGNKLDKAQKLELINEIDHQSTRKVDLILISHASNPDILVRETVKQKTATLTEIKIIADEGFLADLTALKENFSHAMPGATFSQILKRLVRKERERIDPSLRAQRSQEARSKRMSAGQKIHSELTDNRPLKDQRASTPAPEWKRSRYIPSAIRHEVWMRDHGHCTFVDKTTGEICGSKHFLELDHVQPFANGGSHEVANLRLRCRAHNQRHAIESFGFTKSLQPPCSQNAMVREVRIAYSA